MTTCMHVFHISDEKCVHTLLQKLLRNDSIFFRVFLADIGNFSFWSDETVGKYTVKYAGQEWTGYWSYVAAINRALDVRMILVFL